MGARVLTFVREADRNQSLLGKLADSPNLQLVRADSPEEAIEQILENEPPGGVLTEIERARSRTLEFLSTLDAVSLHIPVVVLSENFHERDAPLSFNLPLEVLKSGDLDDDLIARVSRSMLQPQRFRQTRPWKVADYLQLAVLSGDSMALEMTFKDDVNLQVDVVGGDIWNAFTTSKEGLGALLPLIDRSSESVAVRPLHRIPHLRHFNDTGRRVLQQLSEGRGSRPSGKNRATQDVDLGPAESGIQTPDTKAVEVARSPGAEGSGDDQGDAYEDLFNSGLEAALARDFETAARAFEEALRLRPGDGRALHNLRKMEARCRR